MNKKQALKISKKIYPDLNPKEPFGFLVEDGILMVTMFDSSDVLILRNQDDILRLINMAKLALLKDKLE
jgi:hypothetical protein